MILPHRKIGHIENTHIDFKTYVKTYVSMCLCGSSKILAIVFILFNAKTIAAQNISKVWVADNDDGTYKNPVINADYSDPDAIRVGEDYYMVSSSFTHIPGLPILHSKDLVNWKIIGHALKKQPPYDVYDKVQHGAGVWAPSIRYHNNEFYIYYPDPDFGIYLVKSKNITGPWSEPLLVEAGKGLIDPCPLWDDNGKTYLVHAYAGSRAGIKSIIVVKEMNKEGTKIIGNAVMVYDGHELDPTIEGPKFYKRNGWYYIFAPGGGVSTGWQTILRSKNIYGPYERKVAIDQGTTSINGPHQGAWVTTQTGQDWFLHFQDKEAYGRVVHLQPMKWINDWPVIGSDKDGDGKGEPILVFNKPNVGKPHPKSTVQDSDEFNEVKFGLQWQWQANPKEGWAYTTPNGSLRMFSVYQKDSTDNLWALPNILGQKFPADEFMVTLKADFNLKHNGESFGLVIVGTDLTSLFVAKNNSGSYVSMGFYGSKGESGLAIDFPDSKVDRTLYMRIVVTKGAMCQLYFSKNGNDFMEAGPKFTAKPGRWVGAKIGMFCTRTNITNDAGFVDIDWIRFERVQ